MNPSSLFNKSFEPVKAPEFIPSSPEKITRVKKFIVPGTSEFMGANSLRKTPIEQLDELDKLIAEGEAL